jgi:hypothetical protein
VNGPPWQDALRADLALCNADKDALRGEVATASAAIRVLERDRVRACKQGGGGRTWCFPPWWAQFVCSGWCCGALHVVIFGLYAHRC